MLRNILLLTPLLVTTQALACSCFGPQTFCESIDTSWVEPDVIVLGKKIDEIQYGMRVEVVQVFSGTANAGDTLMVWGDNGALCRWYVSTWNDGDTVLWAFHDTDLSGNWIGGTNFEQPGDQHISICGIYWLSYANGLVTGPIAPGVSAMDIGVFGGLVGDCSFATGISGPLQEPGFTAVQIGDDLIIELPLQMSSSVHMTMYSITGAMVYEGSLRAGRSTLPIGSLPTGVFLLQVRNDEMRLVRTVIID